MSITMYEATVPQFIRMLGNLKGILQKAATHAAEKKIDETAFTSARLFPDMLPLTAQVQIATDMARGTVARLAGLEPPKVDDNEKTFAELIARVDLALDYLRAFSADKLDGAETREVKRSLRGRDLTFTGLNYLAQFGLPNFYFHVTATYAILRHNGVDLGKSDFIGPLS
jgi:hypothetical protein